MSIKDELYRILGNLIKSKTIYSLGRADDENIVKLGYPRLEFKLFEINLNEDMSLSNTYLEESMEIEDNYNRISRYMLDITAIYTPKDKINIDELLKFLTNYYKLDTFFHLYNFKGIVKDIVVNRDFRSINKNEFYLDQSISRDGYTFTFDVETTDTDRIPAGVIMRRGEYIE